MKIHGLNKQSKLSEVLYVIQSNTVIIVIITVKVYELK